MEKPTPQTPQNDMHDHPPTYQRDAPANAPGSPPLGEQPLHTPQHQPQTQPQPQPYPQPYPQATVSNKNPGILPPNNNAVSPGQMPMGCIPLQHLQTHPGLVQCPACGQRGTTIATPQSGGFTHGIAALACFVACLGCIPYCISSLKDVHHKCAHCGTGLAHFHRSGRTELLASPVQ